MRSLGRNWQKVGIGRSPDSRRSIQSDNCVLRFQTYKSEPVEGRLRSSVPKDAERHWDVNLILFEVEGVGGGGGGGGGLDFCVRGPPFRGVTKEIAEEISQEEARRRRGSNSGTNP